MRRILPSLLILSLLGAPCWRARAEDKGSDPALLDAIRTAFREGRPAPLLAHLPTGRPVIIDAPPAGVRRGAYSPAQAHGVLERIFSRYRGGPVEILSGRTGGVIRARWRARSARDRAPVLLRLRISRTGAEIREIRLER